MHQLTFSIAANPQRIAQLQERMKDALIEIATEAEAEASADSTLMTVVFAGGPDVA